MTRLGEHFWRLLPQVRPRERHRFGLFLVLLGLLSLAQTLGLAGAEALFLTQFGVETLPLLFIVASGATMLGSFVYASWVGRTRNDSYFIFMLLLCAALLAIATVAAAGGARSLYPALLAFQILTSVILFGHYSTFCWDYFDTRASKRLFPLLVIGSSIGGAAGGGLAVLLNQALGPIGLIGAWATALAGAAGLLRAFRRPLRRWGPLELEEADETSIHAMGQATAFIRRSAFGGWLVVSTLGMVLALFLSQFLYSELLLRAYPEPEALARFLGIFLAVANLLEIGIAAWFTPWLVRTAGVTRANLLHPALMLLSFGALFLNFGFGPALAARFSRESVENALAQPVRTLTYNAVPFRFRGQIKAILEGVVYNGGMLLAGLTLLMIGPSASPFWLCLAGGTAALVYLGANLAAGRQYLRSLVEDLRARRFDFEDTAPELGTWEAARLADLWENLIRDAGAQPSQSELRLASLLTERGILDPVLRTASHPDPRVRRTCIEALAPLEEERVEEALLQAAEDEDSGVRIAALLALTQKRNPARVSATLQRALDDPDARIRAAAAARSGSQGEAQLARMLRGPDSDEALAALERLPAGLAGAALERADDPDPEVRAAVMQAATRLDRAHELALEGLLRDLREGDPGLRRQAASALRRRDERAARDGLAEALSDPDPETRNLASAGLGSLGDAGVRTASALFAAPETTVAEAALRAVAIADTPLARKLLKRELRLRVREAWTASLALDTLAATSHPPRFLAPTLANLVQRNRQLAFRILELLEESVVMHTVERVLLHPSARSAADALEVLANLGDREASELLVLLLEDRPLAEKISELTVDLSHFRGLEEILEWAQQSGDPWLRMAAALSEPGARRDAEREERMERLLILREVPVFENFTLDQLSAINRIIEEVPFLEGEVLMRENDLGGDLYLLIEGAVEVFKNYASPAPVHIDTVTPVGLLGEMSALGDSPRSATLVATSDSRTLRIGRNRFRDLILQIPEMSFAIFGVLSERLREANDQIARQAEELRRLQSSRSATQ